VDIPSSVVQYVLPRVNGQNIAHSFRQNLDVMVDSIPGTWSESRPKKYSPISVRLYLTSYNSEGITGFIQGQGIYHGAFGSQLLN